MSSTRSLISDKAPCFSQSERALYGNLIIKTVNLPVIRIISMTKRICLLLTWADHFYRHSSVSGMCKRITTSALIRRSEKITVQMMRKFQKGMVDCSICICFPHSISLGLHRQQTFPLLNLSLKYSIHDLTMKIGS